MTVATVTTDINIGPFKIPANGQNMIMINYAQRNNLTVELAIPEPMKSNALATVQWLHKDRKLTRVILLSMHQLPVKKKELEELINNMKEVEFHFALENLKGKGKNFLIETAKEALIFMKASNIESKEKEYLDLHKIIQKQ
tara:strand:+ start:2516 stop:2938 length:423 start_codon:yes stop_codon:yes gene_type:complete